MIYDTDKLIDRVYKIPELKKLSNFRCFEYIETNLVSEINGIIENISYKKGFLYFEVKHPAHKMYLQYQLNEIETLLKQSSSCFYILENFQGYHIRVSQ